MKRFRPTIPAASGRPSAPEALVLTPRSVNFFNDIAGRRLGEALGGLGWKVRMTTLKDYAGEEADVAFLVSIVELFVACGSPDEARANLEAVRRRCGTAVMWLLEPTGTRWFDDSYRLFRECGLEILADYAMHDQSGALDEEQRRTYHHLFYGLTESEKHRLRAVPFDDDARAIPWVFVGLKTAERCRLAGFLVEQVDPAGFLYLTDVLPITDHGPHLKDAPFQRVLRRSRYQIWRAQHSSFYMEGERFRRSAMAGCVPLKVVVEDLPRGRDVPFAELVVTQEELADRLAPGAFRGLRSAFLEEYCRLPSLEEELDRFVASLRGGRAVARARGAA